MVKVYTKSPLTVEQQLQRLKDRGLIIEDDDFALSQLRTISYYRLSAYWYPFRKIEQGGTIADDFEEGTHFDEVMTLYEFDRRLRLLVMDAIERVEVCVRTLFAYQIGRKYGTFGHTEAANFHPAFDHAPWLEKLEDETSRSRDVFIIHYKNKYAGFPTLPIWMLTEIMSLGSLSRGYWGLKHGDKKIISNDFALPHKCLADWLHTLTYIRNLCSHHGRLWNRELSIRPGTMRNRNWNPPITPRNDRLFYILLMLRYLLSKTDAGCLTSITLSAWRQLSWPHLLVHGFTVLLFLPVTPTFQFNDGGVMNESVDRRHGHHVVREDGIPFTERLV